MWPHVQWPHLCLTTALHPCLFPLHPQLLLALFMDPATMEALMERMMENMTHKGKVHVCVCVCVCVFACLSSACSGSVFQFQFNRGAAVFGLILTSAVVQHSGFKLKKKH